MDDFDDRYREEYDAEFVDNELKFSAIRQLFDSTSSSDMSSLHDEREESTCGRPILTFSKSAVEDRLDKQTALLEPLNIEPISQTSSGGVTLHPGLKFKIVTVRLAWDSKQKKHVVYTIRICKDSSAPDPHPAVIERRYSDFRQLFVSLRREFPLLMAHVSFPRKVLMGNFGNGVISYRRACFEILLMYAAKTERICQSPSLALFLQKAEQQKAHSFMMEGSYDMAVPLLENAFRLLNKLYTDRHPVVIIALCRLVACLDCGAADSPWARGKAVRYADLALRRFEAVSDADLLKFYVPLLQLCVRLWWTLGRDKLPLTKRLEDIKRRGTQVDGLPTLYHYMMAIEE